MSQPDKPKVTVVDLDFDRNPPQNAKAEPARFACQRSVRILSCESRACEFGPAELTCCWDCGISLQSPMGMKVGDQFFADLRLERSELVLYTVVHCEPSSSGGYRIDAELAASAKARGEQIFRLLLAG